MEASISKPILDLLHEGTVIPAHPLALDNNLKFDEEKQRRLTRYYMASGAGGIAIGVHTTQFEIRKPSVNLYEPVLKIASEEIESQALSRPFIKIAGICGPLPQAVTEAELARNYGYDFGLISLGGLSELSEKQLLQQVGKVSELIPIFGFYLQPAVGGRLLSYEFWREFVEIPNVHAIKVATFNRYQTLDVVRAVCDSHRRNEIALYTGNDDNIVADLLSRYQFFVDGRYVEKRFVGGLLGHWAFWTSKAVELLKEIKNCLAHDLKKVHELLAKATAITDMNAVVFDARNCFKGCIPGIHEILRGQGLLGNRLCLDPHEELSPGQKKEIDRVHEAYPSYNDDAFVKEFIAADFRSGASVPVN